MDLALGPFGMTEARSKVVEFSQPIMIHYFRILVKRSHPRPNPWGFFNPLRPAVWLGLLLSLMLVCVVLTLLVFFSVSRSRCPTNTTWVAQALNQCWDQLANLLQQSE